MSSSTIKSTSRAYRKGAMDGKKYLRENGMYRMATGSNLPIPACPYNGSELSDEWHAGFKSKVCFRVSKTTDYLAAIGSKGGKAKGKAKVRGDKAYYQRIRNLAVKLECARKLPETEARV